MSSDRSSWRARLIRTPLLAIQGRIREGWERVRRHSSRRAGSLSLRVSAVILLILLSTVAGAAPDGIRIPAPEPGVEKQYDDTFRVLASNDSDPGRGSSTVGVFEYAENGTITTVNRTVETQPVHLWDGNIQSQDALKIATESDMYQSQFSGQVQIPYRDEWTTLSSWYGPEEYRILPIYAADPSRATSTDGQYTVEVRHPNGWWNPVYNAEIGEVDGNLTVTNPNGALVLSSSYTTVIDRKIDIVESLLQYSELASSNASARQRSVVPMNYGTEVFPTADGARVDLQWRSEPHPLVQDAYVGNIDVYPGVWHDDRYVTPSWQFDTYVPWDYRVEAPSNHTESGTCTIAHEYLVGNTTVVYNRTYPLTRWAEYEISSSNASIVNVTAGPISMDQSSPGMWTTMDFETSRPRPLSPGPYNVTARLRVDVELETRFGVSSNECPEWNSTRTTNRTFQMAYTVPVETVNSEDLAIAVDVFDRPGDDIISVAWLGEQGLAPGAAAWEDVEIQVGEKTMYVTAPWRFYSVSRNTNVQMRTATGSSSIPASHSYDGAYPAMLRYRMSPANVSVITEPAADRHVWWESTHQVPAGSVPPATLPSSIIAPENEKPTSLYQEYAGVLKSTDLVMGENVTARSQDVWGMPIDTSVQVTRYRDSRLTVTVNESTGTAEVLLTDIHGIPIPGRTITFEGATVSSATTDATGQVTVGIASTLVRAHFAGDDWRDAHRVYYLETHSYGVSQTAFVAGFTGVFGYLSAAISNMTLFLEWLVFGIFALLWMRYTRKQPV